jgi:hypothetical protein
MLRDEFDASVLHVHEVDTDRDRRNVDLMNFMAARFSG